MQLTENQIRKLGGDVQPFERLNFDQKDSAAEKIYFSEYIYDASKGSKPVDAVVVNPIQLLKNRSYGKYLWVINREGLKIILEAIANPAASRKLVCHSNITKGGRALQAGELWFGSDNNLYINFRSGRYGATNNDQRNSVLEYFSSIGHHNIVVID